MVLGNSELVNYVSFSAKESEGCKSFFDFGDILKEKIWERIGEKTDFDLVGHSMGGLDAVAAITDEEDTLLNVNKLITVATPHQGSELGELGPIVRKFEPHHALQCINLDPDQPAIKSINKIEVREKLLDRVQKLYCLMGTRDMAVMRSARFNKIGIDPKRYHREGGNCGNRWGYPLREIGNHPGSMDDFGCLEDPLRYRTGEAKV